MHRPATTNGTPHHVAAARRNPPGRTSALGGFFLCMGGVHIGIASTDPQTYAPFADQALFGFVRAGWSEVFMAHPTVWGLLLAAGETTIGALLLWGGPAARAGWVAAIGFQVLLGLFGWGFWLWSVPATAVLVWAGSLDWARLAGSSRHLSDRRDQATHHPPLPQSDRSTR